MHLLVDTTIRRVVFRGPEYLLHRFRRQYQKENREHQLMIPGTSKDGFGAVAPRYYPDLASPEHMFTALYDGRAALRADYAADIEALQHYEREAE